MIISASRRTDIPNYYGKWFFQRLKEGFAWVRNPVDPARISRVSLEKEVVDCIVFWTKNPRPMMKNLELLEGYEYYFQYTLTGYGRAVERYLPGLEDRIKTFQELSERIGKKRVIWRYDPILFTGEKQEEKGEKIKAYTPDWHLETFRYIGEKLEGYTKKCVISFADFYRKNEKNMRALGVESKSKEELLEFAEKLAETAKERGFSIASCGEEIDLSSCGIEHNACIDKKLIEELTGCRLKAGRDRTQRAECLCAESIDIGAYDTCRTGCLYCYANFSDKAVERMVRAYDWSSPELCPVKREGERVTERKVSSLKEFQYSLFDD